MYAEDAVLIFFFPFLLLVGLVTWLIVDAADTPSPAVEMCVTEKMETLESVNFWTTESERGAAVDAVTRYCWDVQ